MSEGKDKIGQKREQDKFLIREQPYTYEDYAALPDTENARYELADGRLELMSSPTPLHQSVILQLVFAIKQTCGKEYILLQDVDLLISHTEVRRPDLSIIRKNRKEIITKKGMTAPPDIVIEILSPSSAKTDKISKAKSYAGFLVPEYWIIDPLNGILEQHVLDGNKKYRLVNLFKEDEAIESDQLPCATFTMNELLSEASELSLE